MSASSTLWTSERFVRSAEGKASGLERVTIVFNEVSALRVSYRFSRRAAWCALPLQDAPQTWHVRTAFCLPAPPSSRFPQSVQKTSEPMAAIAMSRLLCAARGGGCPGGGASSRS
jgi:hypothetical protein